VALLNASALEAWRASRKAIASSRVGSEMLAVLSQDIASVKTTFLAPFFLRPCQVGVDVGRQNVDTRFVVLKLPTGGK
jgi:hypothetical protein